MKRRWGVRAVLALTSSVLAFVLVGELGLRLWNPQSVQLFNKRVQGNPGEMVVMIDSAYEAHPKNGVLQTDDVLGYRPVLGGKEYGPHGAKWNDYALEKPAGKRRLLFIGDSVTDRHKI